MRAAARVAERASPLFRRRSLREARGRPRCSGVGGGRAGDGGGSGLGVGTEARWGYFDRARLGISVKVFDVEMKWRFGWTDGGRGRYTCCPNRVRAAFFVFFGRGGIIVDLLFVCGLNVSGHGRGTKGCVFASCLIVLGVFLADFCLLFTSCFPGLM